eukprot:c27093_g1_i1 orf=282-635(+)
MVSPGGQRFVRAGCCGIAGALHVSRVRGHLECFMSLPGYYFAGRFRREGIQASLIAPSLGAAQWDVLGIATIQMELLGSLGHFGPCLAGFLSLAFFSFWYSAVHRVTLFSCVIATLH